MITRLLAYLALAIGLYALYRGFTTSPLEEGQIAGMLLSSLMVILAIGYLLGSREVAVPTRSEDTPTDDPAADSADSAADTGSTRPGTVYLVVIGDEDSDADIDRVDSFLQQDARATSTTVEEGCWYSNGEDGPRWVRLIVGCAPADRDALKKITEAFVAEELGGGLSVNYY